MCPQFVSGNQVEFSAEIMVHRDALKNVNNSDVMLFPRVLVCMACGFSQFTVPKPEIMLLASDSPNDEGLTTAAAG
jgi:hypothetical protein